MIRIPSTTIFSNNPLTPQKESEKTKENRKLSYWLEKLHIQGEEIKNDNNRREEKASESTDTTIVNQGATSNQDILQSGVDQHTKNIAMKHEADTQKVNDLVRKSNRSIISISSFSPWRFQSNTI